MANNKRENYFRELAGLRIVSMYVQEFFHWGWQPLAQQNDDGIDGYVIIRDAAGRDLGCNIRVQIKSGPGYLKGRPNKGKHVKIQPYTPVQALSSHMVDYKISVLPVIMVWVNTQKERPDGTTYEDLFHPEAWWECMDTYPYAGESQITLTHKFGEHSKGDWFDTVKLKLKSWENHPIIEMDKTDRNLFLSINQKVEARAFYKDWQTRNTCIILGPENGLTVKKTRTGWRHINYMKRGKERIQNSLRLLSVAEKIILSKDLHPVRLDEKEMIHGGTWGKIGLRARVIIDRCTIWKVQVVLLVDERRVKETRECEFFSVHVIK